MGRSKKRRSSRGDSKPLKCQKVLKIQNDGDKVDHISSLGDTLLSHILSFLTTKQAVITSLLSKRWRHVWTENPVLDFSVNSEVMKENWGIYWPETPDLCFPVSTKAMKKKKVHFVNFVGRVLHMNNVLCLKKLSFASLLEFDLAQVSAWIANLNARCIEDVELEFGHFSFPGHQALLQSLVIFLTRVQPVILAIVGGNIEKLPIFTHQFSHLKILHLREINSLCSDSMNRLLASCPVIEGLHITLCNCKWRPILIESSTLKDIALEFGICIPLHVVRAPYLQKVLLASGGRCDSGSYSPLKCLVEAQILMYTLPLGFLQAMNSSQILHIRCSWVERNVQIAMQKNQLWFENLTHLVLRVSRGVLPFLSGMLRCLPNLVSIVLSKSDFCFRERISSGCPEYVKWIPPPDVPKCVLSCLESVEIKLLHEDSECENCLGMVGYFIRIVQS